MEACEAAAPAPALAASIETTAVVSADFCATVVALAAASTACSCCTKPSLIASIRACMAIHCWKG